MGVQFPGQQHPGVNPVPVIGEETAPQHPIFSDLRCRCGIDPQEYFSGEDFARIYDFNTLKTLAILGAAASDIAEMPLREIASTVLPLYWEEEKQNRTFAGNPDRQYNDNTVLAISRRGISEISLTAPPRIDRVSRVLKSKTRAKSSPLKYSSLSGR